MPFYTFENINTGEEQTLEMTISEMEQFKVEHPELIQILAPNGTVDPILLGITKPPSDFQKHVLGKIKREAGQDNTIGRGRWEVP